MTLLTMIKQFFDKHECEQHCGYSTHDLVQLEIHHEIEHAGDFEVVPHPRAS